jgi:hypothetical protein
VEPRKEEEEEKKKVLSYHLPGGTEKHRET